MMNNVNGRSHLYGIIGNPIEHTLSPFIHNFIAEKCGHNNIYLPFLVENDIENAIKGAFSLNIKGMNVTVPYKEKVIKYLVGYNEAVENIGACNMLVRKDNGYYGYNTDASGLARAMKADGVELLNKVVVILGAGGAARSSAYVCASEGVKKIYILNRTLEKATKIAEMISDNYANIEVVPLNLYDYNRVSEEDVIAIQTTNVGLNNITDVIISDESFYDKIEVGYELNYCPAVTKFMKILIAKNRKAYNGLKMLEYQAIEAYEKWNDVVVSEEIAEELYQLLKKEK